MTLAALDMSVADAVDAQEIDERDLLERARRDRSSFGQLYRQHARAIAAYIYRRTGDVHVTEDLVSEVFLSALRTVHRYQYRGVPLRHWLLRIATRAVNRWARRQRKHQVLPESDIIDPESNGQQSSSELERDDVLRALLNLSPKYQTVLSLHYLEGLPVRDVAAIAGAREGTIKSRLSRARDALREELGKRRYGHES